MELTKKTFTTQEMREIMVILMNPEVETKVEYYRRRVNKMMTELTPCVTRGM